MERITKNKSITNTRKETFGKALTLFLGIICFLGITIAEAARYEVLTVNKLEITRGGSITPMDTLTFGLGAAERIIIDASTTAQTQTNGVIDLNVAAGTANVSGFDLTLTTPTGTAAGTDVFAQKINLIQNDADADMFGLKITGTATTNAAAGSYEYLLMLDCAENTAGACPDGLLVTSSGVNAGMTDGIDVSAANIANAINIGVNPILGGNAETFSVGITDGVFTMGRNDTGAVTLTSADDDATADLNVNPSGNAALNLGSSGDTVNVLATTGIGLSNSETVSNGTDGTVFLGRNDTGTVTLSSKDDDATAAMTIDPGGTATLTLGSSADTISVAATSGVTLSNSESINNGTNGAFDFTRNDSGTVTITSSDDDATADMTIAPGGNSTLTLNDTSNDTLAIVGQAQVRAGDLTVVADTTGGNMGAVNQFIGIPRIQNVGISTMVNGAAASHTVITDIGDSETPATDWTAIDGDTVMSNDSSYYRQGTASLKMAIATTAAAADGCTNTLASGDQDWTDDESVGMWIWSDTALTAGDLTLVITDSVAGDTSVNFPAVTALSWQWIEIDVSGVANASKDVITDLSVELSAAGAVVASGGAFNVYMDFIVKWDVGDEDSLGVAILTDGVMSLTTVTATDASAASANLVLYTDYFVHYQSGSDAVVMITDQSTANKVGIALVAY